MDYTSNYKLPLYQTTDNPDLISGYNEAMETIDDTVSSLRDDVDNIGTVDTSNFAPKNHASSATTYGVGSSTLYGHVKTNDLYSTSNIEWGSVATASGVVNYVEKQFQGELYNTWYGTGVTGTVTDARFSNPFIYYTIKSNNVYQSGILFNLVDAYNNRDKTTDSLIIPVWFNGSTVSFNIEFSSKVSFKVTSVSSNMPELWKLYYLRGPYTQ